MVKALDEGAAYVPGKRSLEWRKLKKDYIVGAADTFDLVVIGAFYGRGRRAGTFGSFLLAAYDDQSDAYQTICKARNFVIRSDLV